MTSNNHAFNERSKRLLLIKSRIRRRLLALAIGATLSSAAHSATVAPDGGVTLWLSYGDSSAITQPSVDAMVQVVDFTGGAGCTPTNDARAAHGAPASTSQCPAGALQCTGRAKLQGDLNRIADYIWESTDGATYLRQVYIADRGRSERSADVIWDIAGAASGAAFPGGWRLVDTHLHMSSANRSCAHDVLHHEFGHYFHQLPDRYASRGRYQGTIAGGAPFRVNIVEGDLNTVMGDNYPHRFVDTTNARMVVDYTPPNASQVVGELLTPSLLTDGISGNDGPDYYFAREDVIEGPFARDEWTRTTDAHVHQIGRHNEGQYPAANLGTRPPVKMTFVPDDASAPGTVLLIDRSGSMSVETDNVPASQYAQEAGLYLFHSALEGNNIGSYVYNQIVNEQYAYQPYDADGTFPQLAYPATGLTNITQALRIAIDRLITEHGESGANGADIILMSDGRPTTGGNLAEQVERASQIGIRIHTLSFGMADRQAMEQISNATQGTSTELSERQDGHALKRGMMRLFGVLRGYTRIATLRAVPHDAKFIDGAETIEGTFVVPPKSADLAFYSMVDGAGDASDFRIELTDPKGTSYVGLADDLALLGRFNGVKSPKPVPGTWKWRISGTAESDFVLPVLRPIEFDASVRNFALDGRLSIESDESRPGLVRLLGAVRFRYPLTGLSAVVHVHRGAFDLGTIELFDDGKSGDDAIAGDGIYTALFDPSEYGLDALPTDPAMGRKALLDAHFTIDANSRPAPNVAYEPGSSMVRILADYQANARSSVPVDVWVNRTVDFVDDPTEFPTPSLHRLEPIAAPVVQPGDAGTMTIEMRGVQPLASQLRSALGRGITVRVVDMEPLPQSSGARVKLDYGVSPNATLGPRTLNFQMGGVRMQLADALHVSR